MTDTVFVTMYAPALGNVQVDAPLQAVATYQAHGWLLLDPNATPPPIASPYLSQPAADSRYLRDWAGAEALTAGAVRVAPDGHVIVRTADGTTRSTYDTTEQAAWTVVGGSGGVASVVGQTGAVTGTQIAADAALRAALVPFWTAGETVTAGAVRMTSLGLTITRNSNGTTRGSYDTTEAALWTVTSGSGGGGAGSPPSATTVRTFYVDPTNGSDSNDGRTWQTAVATIAQALTLCNGTGVIWLSRGVHNVTATLVIPQAVKLRGFGSLLSQETEIVWTGADDGSYAIRTAADTSGADFSRGQLSGFLLRPNASKPGGGAYTNLNGLYARNLQNGAYLPDFRVQNFPGIGIRADWANAAVPAGAFPGWVTFDRVWSTGNNINWSVAGGFTSVLYNMCAGDISSNTTDVFVLDPPTGGTVLGRQGQHIFIGFKTEDNGTPTGAGATANYFTVNSDAGVSMLGCSAKKGTPGTKPWINYTATPGSQNAVPGSIPVTLHNCQTSNLPIAVQGPGGVALLVPSVGTGGQSFNIASWSGHANAPTKWSGTHSGFTADGVTVHPSDGTVPALLAGSAPVPTVAPHQFQAPVFFDTFTAADSASAIPAPDAGSAGTAVTGTWGISSNKAYLVSATNNALYSWDAGLADGTLHADITLSSGQGFPGLAFRTVDGANGLSVRYKSTTGELLLMHTVSGALTGLRSATVTWAAGATRHLSVDMQGPVITVFLDGVQIFTYTLTGSDATSFTTPTKIGMRQNGNAGADSNADDGGSRYDNISFVAAVVRISTGGALQVLSGGVWTTVSTGSGSVAAHAATHVRGGSDPVSVGALGAVSARLASSALMAETVPRTGVTTQAPAAGVVYLARITLQAGTYSTVTCCPTVGGAGLANAFFGLYDVTSLALLATSSSAVTALQTTVGSAQAPPTVPMSFTVTTAGDYYLALLIGSGTTMPTLVAGNIQAAALQSLLAPFTCHRHNTTGLTALPSTAVLMSAPSAMLLPWARYE